MKKYMIAGLQYIARSTDAILQLEVAELKLKIDLLERDLSICTASASKVATRGTSQNVQGAEAILRKRVQDLSITNEPVGSQIQSLEERIAVLETANKTLREENKRLQPDDSSGFSALESIYRYYKEMKREVVTKLQEASKLALKKTAEKRVVPKAVAPAPVAKAGAEPKAKAAAKAKAGSSGSGELFK